MAIDDSVKWPGWEVTRLIGNGSFGSVYEIQRNLYGNIEKAALKVIHIPQSQSDIDELYNDGFDEESITARFNGYLEDIIREYSLMASLKGNKNVVYCDDVRQIQHEDGIGWDIYIKMELLTPLVKVLGKEVSEEQVINIGIDMCNALALCKEQSIVHRDIKPQNIFVSKDGIYKLGDFGIAKTAERTTSGTKTGTYKYMAPEVYKSQPYGAAADQYSLGMVLYWLLNERRTPFLPLPSTVKATTVTMEDAARKRRFDGEQIPPPAHGSKELQEIVLKACAYNPKDRFSSAEEMLQALRLIEHDHDTYAAKMPSVTDEETTAASGTVTAYGTIEEGTIGVFYSEEQETSSVAVANTSAAPLEANAQKKENAALRSEKQTPLTVNNTQTDTKKKKRFGWIAIAAALAVAVLGAVLLLNKDGNSGKGNSSSTTEIEAQPVEEKSIQLEWTQWEDALPSFVTDEDYLIEERTVYSSRRLETTSSTKSNTMDGWELFDTVEGNGDFGPWSDWSQSQVTQSDKREIATQTRYRYSDKETTTGSNSTLAGWELYDTTYEWGNWGNWSYWSTNSVLGSDSRKIETKTQYRYRDITYTQKYTDWGSWSSWQSDYVSSNNVTDVQTRTVYGYYWYECPNCGAHMHGWGFTCPKWAGGCGKAELKSDYWHVLWSTTPTSSVNFGDWYGTGHYYAYVDGILVFRWDYGNPGPQTQYSYRTRSTTQEAEYGTWSNWGDTSYSSSSNREVESRTVYRYSDRSQIPTYHFFRWKDWSSWSETAVSQSDTRKVETATFYRYRDRVKETTYYFQRWTDWSDFTDIPVEKSDTVEVETKTQYRYRSK